MDEEMKRDRTVNERTREKDEEGRSVHLHGESWGELKGAGR